MFIERLINQGNAPLAEQVLKFTAARHKLLQENVANVSTPNYRNKDLDVAGFQSALRDRVAARREGPPGATSFRDIGGEAFDPNGGFLFHDRNNRSMEQLTVDGMKNALMHNLAVELLKKQFGSLESALRERLS
jgi:flagellar basal-body rod protein FlgB